MKLPMRAVEPEPWSIGVRLADQPQGVHRYTIRPGTPAGGRTIAELEELPDESWISFVVRGLLQVRGGTRLHAGDEILVLSDDDCDEQLKAVFDSTRDPCQERSTTSFTAAETRSGPAGRGREGLTALVREGSLNPSDSTGGCGHGGPCRPAERGSDWERTSP